MTLTIQLSPEAEQKLLERAAQSGQTLAAYVQILLETEALTQFTGQKLQGNQLTPALRDWLCQQVNEAETVADLQELREKGGQELAKFLPDLEQVIHRYERSNRSPSAFRGSLRCRRDKAARVCR